ncbi:ExeA family protein [Dongia deserti]|uniref:ExeA family protein n=1 Tax=Dongia deserti TaxID=2268030 RepID=UPI000E658BC4|nr:AAA family ATPase [Dongia deserti]
MYESFFGLREKPFSLLPDPDFLFMSSKHSLALSILEYSLAGQAGFCAITGDIGSGKTTLIRSLLRRIGRDVTLGLISNTHTGLTDITAWALASFGRGTNAQTDAEIYQELMHFLIEEYAGGRRCILVVDEAQNLTVEALEELRLLSNINSDKDLLLQIILVGQPELLMKLKSPELTQFAQRISISYHLTPLNYLDTRRYIRHRLEVAGADRPIFTDTAIGAVQFFSGGVPRVINSICDMAMVYGLADNRTDIDLDIVLRVIADRQASGVSPFIREERADDPMVVAEITAMVREAVELRAVPGENDPSTGSPRASDLALDEEPALDERARFNGHVAVDDYARLEVPQAGPNQGYGDLRIDALSLNDYRTEPKRGEANESQRPSWFRRTFRRTS